MRVIFFGTSAFAVPSLERLVAGRHTIVMCVTRPDRRQGRGLAHEPSPIKRTALQLGVPLSQPECLQANLFETLHPDIGVVVAFGQVIRRELLELPTHGMLGVHPSLLPKYRGAAPVAWALLHGESTTGVTIFRLNEYLDAGEVVSQRSVSIEPEEDAQELTERLAHLGAEELLHALEAIESRRAIFTLQDASQATMAPKLTKAQGRIDWSAPSKAIVQFVRATTPWPGASTTWREGVIKVCAASIVETSSIPSQAAPGIVIHVAADALAVAAGQGAVALREVQLTGRRRMSIKEFLAGHHVKVGERFGSDK